MVNVDSFHLSHTLLYRRFLISFASAEFADSASLLEFAFEFLQRLLDIVTFFDLYDNHFKITSFSCRRLTAAILNRKVTQFFLINKKIIRTFMGGP